jgi:VWFA-related protein
MCRRLVLILLFVPAVLFAQDPQLPRFRAGANLVRVDAYVSKDNVAVTSLAADDFLVYEDDKPQTIAAFEVMHARGPLPASERRDATNTRDMRQQAADAVRLFTLFFDPRTISMSGAYRVRKPLLETLEKVIGPDDAIGVMTPEMSPSSIIYGKRVDTIERMIEKWWIMGGRDRSADMTPQEEAIAACYPVPPKENAGIAAKMIARIREQRTLDALGSLITHLEGLRDDRKFVMVFTEGWMLYQPDPSVSRNLKGTDGPVPDPIAVDPRTGGLRPLNAPDPQTGMALSLNQCEQQRVQLSQLNHEQEFLQLLQRANRANVSFYPVDARGLVVFDQPTNFDTLPTTDQARLRHRWDYLRDMAAQTDGQAILDQGDLTRAFQKVFRDLGSYYLLSYYSTNSRLDGRFRRIRVEVKPDGLDVRARPGYLAPTEEEARASSAATAAVRNGPPPTVSRALDSIAPARGFLPARLQAAGGRNSIRAVVELDAATLKQPEWIAGGTVRLTFQPESAAGAAPSARSQTVTAAIDPGQRSIIVDSGSERLAAGSYSVRAELTARNTRQPIQVTTAVIVPDDASEFGTGLLASRRGPGTGLAYVGTADPRFRRTERLRVEVPLAGEGVSGQGRVLTREGQSTPLAVTFAARVDEPTQKRFGVAEVVLAPLAAGDYVLELTLGKDGKSEAVSYGFRIIP